MALTRSALSAKPLPPPAASSRHPRPPGTRVHLIGLGSVGRAFLSLEARPLGARSLESTHRVLGVSDRSATFFSARGVDAPELCHLKSRGRSLSEYSGSRFVSLEVLARLLPVDVVVDATDSSPSTTDVALRRTRTLIDSGKRVVLAAKNGLLAGVSEWLTSEYIARIGINAVLGGTGRALQQSLAQLRTHATEIACVPNATTTALIEAIERGSSFDEALERCRGLGLLEADASLDLDGTDAATKIAIVAKAVFAQSRAINDVSLSDIGPVNSAAELDPGLLRDRARRGLTTRLVARADRDSVRLQYESVPRGSALAVSSQRVVYTYSLDCGRRDVHVGTGLGPEGTAAALLADLTPARTGGDR